jgi:hypothetical protein
MARIICSLFSTLVQKWLEYGVLWVENILRIEEREEGRENEV